jgi:hypothetical protein
MKRTELFSAQTFRQIAPSERFDFLHCEKIIAMANRTKPMHLISQIMRLKRLFAIKFIRLQKF